MGLQTLQAWIFGPLYLDKLHKLGQIIKYYRASGFCFFSHTHSSVINSFNIYSVPRVCWAFWIWRMGKWFDWEGAGDQHSTTRTLINTQLQIVVSATEGKKTDEGLTLRQWYKVTLKLSEKWERGGGVRQKRKYSSRENSMLNVLWQDRTHIQGT